MTRRSFLSTLAATPVLAQRPRKPNIILILADDLGYGDLGCYGQKQILTPHLDRMAAEGMRFTQGYAGSTVCAPSRCALMTGFHTGHARTRGNRSPDLPLRPEDVTLTDVLKRAGYHTGLFGKWSLGGLGSTGYPTRKGFDEWFGYFSQTHAHNYYPEHLLDGEHEFLLRGNTGTQRKDWAHDRIHACAMDFLGRATAQPEPFFAHLCYTIPHANNEMGRDTGNGMEVPSDEPYSSRPWPQPEKNFAAMITRLDASVGQVLDLLRRTGRDRNTLVIFTSDNGPHQEGGHNPAFFESSGALRGIKRDLTEGGIRVPLVARWPGRIAPRQTSDQIFPFWDMLPTLAEAAGAAAPRGIDGISVFPALAGRPQSAQHPYLYWEFHERGFHQAVRAGNWKGIRLGQGKPLELYDLSSDIGERTNVASEHPDVVKRIEKILAEARTESEFWPARDDPAAKREKPKPIERSAAATLRYDERE